MLSEGSQPYACYKNSARVSDAGMNRLQPARRDTLQQGPECSSRCGMDGKLRDSPGAWPGRAHSGWTQVADSAPEPGPWPPPAQRPSVPAEQEFLLLGGTQQCWGLWEPCPTSGTGPNTEVLPAGEEKIRKQPVLPGGGQGFGLDNFAPVADRALLTRENSQRKH